MHRRLALGATAAAFTAFGGHAAHSASQQNNTAVKLDRKNAQLRLVQVVFRYVCPQVAPALWCHPCLPVLVVPSATMIWLRLQTCYPDTLPLV